MRPFDQHIYALLLDHDCVIVPEFGGFIASKEKARVDSSLQQAIPPRRTVAFNAFLKENDGLLARRLVEAESISYPEAMQEIEGYVAKCTDDLEQGRKINIRKVGSLQIDPSRQLRFEPDAQSMLLPEAFGFSVIPAQPVRSGETRKKEKRNPIRAKRPAGKSKERTFIAAILIAGALAWLSVNVFLVSNKQAQRTSPVAADSARPQSSGTTTLPQPVTTTKAETVFVAQPATETTAVSETPSIAQPDTTAVRTRTVLPLLQGQGDFYVVGGVFRVRENAVKFVAGLQAEGFTDAGVIDTSRKIFYVSYGRCETREAAAALNQALKKKSKECWIYQRKASR